MKTMEGLNLKQIRLLFKKKQSSKMSVLVKQFCGEKIGVGLYRDVHIFRFNPKYVVKVERDPSCGSFANATEWRNYINNKDWAKLGPWLAPCEFINETGQILIQRRVEHRDIKLHPKKIPSVFTDKKYGNFGWIGNKFVCCDYSYLVLTELKMVNARWWSHDKKKR